MDPGDDASSRCSAPEWPCWPIVGGQRLPVVDRWTSRRLFTGVRRRPPLVPCVSRPRPPAALSRCPCPDREVLRTPAIGPRLLVRLPTPRVSPYPQAGTTLGTVSGRFPRADCPYAAGDHRRQVEKLSPGMCTGWGDLVPTGSRPVTAVTVSFPTRNRAPRPIRRVDQRERRPTRTKPPITPDRPRTPGHGLGTEPGDAGDRSWTVTVAGAQPSRCPRVDNRKTLTPHSEPTGPFRR